MVQRISPENYFHVEKRPKPEYTPLPQYAKFPKTEYAPYQDEVQPDLIKGIIIGAGLILLGIIVGASIVYLSKR